MKLRRTLLAAAFLALVPLAARAQEGRPPLTPLAVGDVAPDFELPGATREGMTPKPVRLSDYAGKTVVIAFFYKARTGG